MPAPGDVEIRILETDAMSFETDVLVLKHAQDLYGLDAQVVKAAHIDTAELPLPDGFRVIRDPTGVAEDGLLFVGVQPIRKFSYADIRRFGYKALCSVASAFPRAGDIALTLHGVGYVLMNSPALMLRLPASSTLSIVTTTLDPCERSQSLRSIQGAPID